MDIQLQDPTSICDFPDDVLVYHPKLDPIHERLDRIDQWCMSNMDKSYLIHRPGNRASGKVPISLRAGFKVSCRSHNDGCMIASLCNVMIIAGFPELCDDAIALRDDEVCGFRRIGTMGDRFTNKNGIFRFPHQRLTVQELCSLESGIFLVRVKGSRGVDHCVCVDGGKRAIIDSFATESIKLSTEGLELCVGDQSSFQGLLEVCKPHITSVAVERKRNCTSSHRRRLKRKRERERKPFRSSNTK